MDQYLFNEIYKHTPKFNPDVAGNICRPMLDQVEQYITDTFIASQKDYPDSLKFIKLERVDPKTEFEKGGWTKDEHDITKNTIYMVQLYFEFNGQPLKPFYLYLPYCYKGGIIVIGGATFALNAVAIDTCLSVTQNSLFLHVSKDKISFNSKNWAYLEGEQRVNYDVVISGIYRGGDKKPKGSTYAGHPTVNMRPAMVHYLFALYGFSGTFEKYLGIKDVVLGCEDITEEYYPPDEWVICSSIKNRPDKYKSKFYTPASICLAIKKEYLCHEARAIIAAFFYMADYFPEKFRTGDFESPEFYTTILAMINLPYQMDIPTAYRDTVRHLKSLSNYIDNKLKADLKQVHGIVVDDIFDLFANIAFTYRERITCTIEELTTMYNKQLTINKYLLEDIVKSIYNLGYDLQSAKNDATFTAEKAERRIDKYIKPLTIVGIKSGHPEVSSVQVPTDNMVVKVVAPIVPQSKIGKSKASKLTITKDMTLNASIAEVGNITSLGGDSTGRYRLNMFVNVDKDGFILRNPDLVEIVDRAQAAIRRDA